MQEYYGNNDYRDYLLHSGRIGMKWYVRNYQDYDTKPTRSGKVGRYYGDPKLPKGYRFKYVPETKNIRTTKNILAYLPKQKPSTYSDEILKVNKKKNVGNCTSCTVALELRARGYDAVAVDFSQTKSEIKHDYNALFKNVKQIPSPYYGDRYIRGHYGPFDSFAEKQYYEQQADNRLRSITDSNNAVKRSILQQGEGARGYITYEWYTPYDNKFGGHILNYQVSHGKVLIFDAQTGDIKDFDKRFDNSKPLYGSRMIESYARLDNLELNRNVGYNEEEIDPDSPNRLYTPRTENKKALKGVLIYTDDYRGAKVTTYSKELSFNMGWYLKDVGKSIVNTGKNVLNKILSKIKK